MVQFDAHRQSISSFNNVDIVICSTSLIYRFQNTISIVPVSRGNMQRLRHQVNQQATVILCLHNLNSDIFQSSFRQVSIYCQLVRPSAARSINMGSATQSNAVTTNIRTVKCTVVDICSNTFFSLAETACQGRSTSFRNCFIQIVLKFFMSHNITKSVCYVGIASQEALDFRIILNRSALLFCGSKTKTYDLYIFFICLIRRKGIEEISIFSLVVLVRFTPPCVHPRPKCLRMIACHNYASHLFLLNYYTPAVLLPSSCWLITT